ncbi:hypothetical protein H4217_007920 [Coemansia sp. RSA 1939]|nr:hypothetical protein H4217_007920 [Coemansia sp. RSA 1939]
MPTAKSGSSKRNMRLAFAIYAIAATTAVAAPVHILIPDVVTLPGGSAVTLYSAPSLNPASAGEIQTGAASEDAVISIDQDMLMRALSQPSPSPNASPNDPAQTPTATDYEEIGNEVARIRNAIMQVSDEPSASGDDNALNLSGILDKLTSSLSHAESSKVLLSTSTSKTTGTSTTTSTSTVSTTSSTSTSSSKSSTSSASPSHFKSHFAHKLLY